MVSFEDFMNDKRPIEEISSSVTFRLSSGTGKDTKSEEITFTYNQSHGVVHTADDILIAGYSELDENGDLVVDKVVSMPSIRRNFLLGEIMEQLSKGAAQESIIQELRGGHIRGQNEEIQFKPSVSSDEEDRNKKTRDFLFGENGYLESIWNNNPLINGEDKKRKAANRAVELSPKEEELLIKNSSFSMINILFFDEGRKRFVDNFFNAPDVSPTRREQSNKKKFTTELFLFDAIFLAIFLQREAYSFKRMQLGEKIWHEFESQLMQRMGEHAYNAYVAESETKKKKYLKVLNDPELMGKEATVFTDCVGIPNNHYFDNIDINLYLGHRSLELLQFCRAILGTKLQDIEKIKVSYKESREKLIGPLEDSVNDDAKFYFDRGICCAKVGDYAQAISNLNEAIEINPNYVEAYINRGSVYSCQKNLSQAISDFTKVIDINPKFANAYFNRGVAYAAQDNLSQAITDYTKAIEINPAHAAAYYNRGVAYIAQGNIPQAITDYTKAIEINPPHAAAYYNRGVAYAEQDNLSQAVIDYTKAIEIDPTYEKAYKNRGLAYAKKDNYIQAIPDFTKAIEINPKNAEQYENRAIAYYYLKEYDMSWADIRKAAELGAKVNPEFIQCLWMQRGKTNRGL